jgi:hypothetical protein
MKPSSLCSLTFGTSGCANLSAKFADGRNNGLNGTGSTAQITNAIIFDQTKHLEDTSDELTDLAEQECTHLLLTLQVLVGGAHQFLQTLDNTRRVETVQDVLVYARLHFQETLVNGERERARVCGCVCVCVCVCVYGGWVCV